MILVNEAGSMRMSGFCDASTCPLVASSKSQDFAAIVGAGTVCATAAEIDKMVAVSAVIKFFMKLMCVSLLQATRKLNQ